MDKALTAFVESQARENFTSELLIQGRKIFAQHSFEESFSKGKSSEQFLSTGLLIQKHSIFNVKIQKRNREDTLDFRCNCTLGKKDLLCEHVAAYFLFYFDKYQNKFKEAAQAEVKASLDPNIAKASMFGDFIKQGSELVSSNYKHFKQIKYTLLSGQTIDFPTEVREWSNKKIIFKLDPIKLDSDKDIFIGSKVRTLLDGAEKVSIFENKYFFNWEDGSLTKVPSKLKKIFSYISDLDQIIDTHFFISLCQSLVKDDVEVFYQEKNISRMSSESLNLVVKVIDGENHLLKLSLSFSDSENNLFLPKLTKLFSNYDGVLEKFSSKSELKRFIQEILNDNPKFSEFTYTLENKEKIVPVYELLNSCEDMIQISPDRDKLYTWNFHTFFKTLQLLFSTLSDNLFLSSKFDSIKSEILFKIPRATYSEKLFDFFAKLKELEIPIYFQERRIKNWNSQIKYNRRHVNSDWFDLNLSLSKEELEFIKNVEFEKKLTKMGDDFILLNEEELRYIKLIKKHINNNKNQDLDGDQISFHLKFNRCQLFDIYQIYKYSGENLLTDDEKEVCSKLLNLKEIPEYNFPTEVKFSPRDYQETGYRWLKLLHELKLGACLADDMGLGKTFQTISFLQSIDTQTKKVLIVCPVSIISNWKSEFEKFSDMELNLYYGESRIINPETKYLITSYGILRKDFETVLKDIEWDVFIMDEVQKLKNIKSLGAQTARQVNARYRICLTGTPVENDISEYYNILDLAVPGIWGSQVQMNYYKKNKDSRFLAREITRPFVLRRTKKQVLHDLPDKTEQITYLDFNKEERKNYISKLAQIRKEIRDLDKGQKYIKVLSNILKLRQLCLWQSLDDQLVSTKINFLISTLEQILPQDHQVLIYSQFTKYLDIIQTEMNKNKWNFSRIDGSYSLKKRVKEIDDFKSGKNKVFLISLKAGGLGLNLTEASYVFLMDPWWNPAIENQAIDRAHRIGQKNKLTIFKPIIKNSVEEKVLDLQEKKRELFDDLLGEGLEKASGKLSFDDFETILSL